MKRDAIPTGGGSAVVMRDVAPKHYASPSSHASKLAKAVRYLGPKWCLKQPVRKLAKQERTTVLDRWKAQRHA